MGSICAASCDVREIVILRAGSYLHFARQSLFGFRPSIVILRLFFVEDGVEHIFEFMSSRSMSKPGGVAGSKEPKVQKSLGELMMDPHFVFTIFSLLISVSVFFYYLYQLLCNPQDWNATEEMEQERRKKRRQQLLQQAMEKYPSLAESLKDDDERVHQLIAEKLQEDEDARIARAKAKKDTKPQEKGASKKDDDVDEKGKPIASRGAGDSTAEVVKGGSKSGSVRRRGNKEE